ncbi:hypothetical protein ACFL0P_04735 [Candidatus Omnitrophota bacterium]
MYKTIRIAVISVLFLSFVRPSFASSPASSPFIGSLSKMRTSRGYIFKVTYKTEDKWTDRLVLKLFCSFNKGPELTFTSTGISNLKKGWHKTEIHVPKVYRDRYGYIKDYRLEMYHKGAFVSLKSL